MIEIDTKIFTLLVYTTPVTGARRNKSPIWGFDSFKSGNQLATPKIYVDKEKHY